MDTENMMASIQQDMASSGRKRKIYKVQSDEFKSEQLSADIGRGISLIKAKRDKVVWSNPDDVRERIIAYLGACQQLGVFPSVMGLAAHGFGVTRQAMNTWINTHPDTESAQIIGQFKEIVADILTNEGLKNNCNNIQVIFQLKNHFDHADKVELAAVPAETEHTPTAEEIAKRYAVYADPDDSTEAELF